MNDRRSFTKHVEETEASLDEEDVDDHDIELVDLEPPAEGHREDDELLEEKLFHIIYEEFKRTTAAGGSNPPIQPIASIGENNPKVNASTPAAQKRKDKDESGREADAEDPEAGEDSQADGDDPISKALEELGI